MNLKYLILTFSIILLYGCSGKKHYKTVIIGGGLMGSSTAWQLAKEGEDILLVEKQSRSYNEGSSQGKSRIARSLGPQDDIWSHMHNTTVAETKTLLKFLNDNDSTSHHITDIYTSSPMNYVRHKNQIERINTLLVNQRDSFLFAKTPERAQELFQMNIADSTIILREYKEHTGTINPYALIQKIHQALGILDKPIWYDSKVSSVQQIENQYQITVERNGKQEIIHADHIVCAAGPYNGNVLNDVAPYVKSLINPQRVFLAFFRIQSEVYNSLSPSDVQKIKNGYPAINSSAGTREGNFFTMIEEFDEDNNPMIKIGGHFQRSDISNLDDVWTKTISESERDWSLQNTLTHLRQLNIDIKASDLEFVKGYSCVYSLTKNEVPIISHLLNENGEKIDNAIILGGLSGVGGKGSLAYGLLAADLFFNRNDESVIYKKVVEKMGLSRLKRDIAELSQ